MASSLVNVKPATLRWACERSRIDPAILAKRFPQLPAWESGEKRPTLKQIEAFCGATHTAVGHFFGGDPPDEPVPIPDFRSIANTPDSKPSGDLLDAVYLCQNRQYWYEEFARIEGEPPLPFVGSASLTDPVEVVAADIRKTLGFDPDERKRLRPRPDVLRSLIAQADDAGVLVMVSAVVGNNTRRKLDPAEFRGFALVDAFAPVVFVNGADTKAAQTFTLAQELAHVWLGETALSDSVADQVPSHRVERWCNEVAAELLVRLAVLYEKHWTGEESWRSELEWLARRGKVSTLVALRQLLSAGLMFPDQYPAAYEGELARLREATARGNFYLSLGDRVGGRFARAIVVSTLEGRSRFTDAFYLLGIKKMQTFRKLAENLGIEHGLPP